MKIVGADGGDGTTQLRLEVGNDRFNDLMAEMNYEFERHMLRGPSDKELAVLREDPDYRPEIALNSHLNRVTWELDTARILNADPRWRRGRLRDVISGREIVHEWLDMFTRLRVERIRSGLPPFDPSAEAMRSFVGAMPHTQVAISVKTRYHKNPRHKWTANDISDIDAVSVAYAYCEALFTDKAVRAALSNSKELRAMGTFLPRRPQELAEWLDALPTVPAPNMLVPHPLYRP